MPSISKVAIQMIFLFALACVWAVSFGWKQQVMGSFEINHAGEGSSILSANEQVDTSSNVGAPIKTSGTDIDPSTTVAG
ncbi:hypothetical protein [Pseudomonas fluorescens]|uniref:Uncharacterized protein n=1 Tax=Pseudomonas fluorescens TaxID=294 RepID=A0A5E7FY17_PSEFL|nr:hypothetical protein [Pseudomonas fluorescens]VVO44289.1 hypothetical protein PS723_06338 [Pseudomonas fluorescens]